MFRTALSLAGPPRQGNNASFALWPVYAGLLVLYVPTYISLAMGAWTVDRNAHGPFILALVLYAFFRSRDQIRELESEPKTLAGGLLFGAGLLLYILGRSQDILVFEVGSQIAVISGLLLTIKSGKAVRVLWFPLVFFLFIIPPPGALVDYITLPLKHYVSVVVDELLYLAGYPVGRSGVVITIGQYQMLIADACSGLNSMYSLSALGVFYIYLRGYASTLQNVVLLLSILPVAFVANVARVISLVLITYYYGDSAGQGFLHDFAGFTELVVALVFLLVLDGFLAVSFRRFVTRQPASRVPGG